MKPAFKQRIIARHSDSLRRFGHHPHALYWSSEEIQHLRFKVLSEIGVRAGDSVLDVGCGFADLKAWLAMQGMDVEYTGLDISPDLIGEAKRIFPTTNLYVGELFDARFLARQFDWVLLSGALNEPYNDKGKYTKRVIREMYRLCRLGVAFNLLNADVVNAPDLQSFSPLASFDMCKEICDDVELRTDYLENDFTLYLRKK